MRINGFGAPPPIEWNGLFRLVRSGLYALMMVAGLVQSVCAAGTWDEFPANSTAEINSCSIDKDGSVYYTLSTVAGQPSILGDGIFVKHNDNNAATNLVSYLPASFVGKKYGVYYDPSRDSIYVGGVDGQVYRGRGTIFTAMPSVPLLYSKLDGSGSYTIKYTHVNGFIRDSKDRLLALTDSLVWYLDQGVQQWKLVGSPSDYDRVSEAFSEGILLPSGDVMVAGWTAGNGPAPLHIIKPNLTISLITPSKYMSGMTRGISGKIHGWYGTGQDYYSVDPANGYTSDTVHLQYPITEGWSSNQTGTIFEDPSGINWIGQHGRVLLVRGDSTLLSIPQGMGPSTGFWLAPDSTFWMCTPDGILRYSEKYRIPPEIASSLKPTARKAAGVRLGVMGQGVLVHAEGAAFVRIVSSKGVMAWRGKVQGEKHIPLHSGLWLVQSRVASGSSVVQKVVVP